MEHTYAECEPVAALLRMVINRWNAATGEELDPLDLKVVLLGDRGEKARAISEEPWRIVHAATMWVVHTTAKARREKGRHRPARTETAVMLNKVRREVQSLLANRYATRGRDGGAEFKQVWIDTGLAIVSGGGVSARVLEGGRTDPGHRGQPTRETDSR